MSKTLKHDRGERGKRRGQLKRLFEKIPQELDALKKLHGYRQTDAQELDLTIAGPRSEIPGDRKPVVTFSINEFSRMVESVEISWEDRHTAAQKPGNHRRLLGKRPIRLYTDNGQDFSTSSLDKPVDE